MNKEYKKFREWCLSHCLGFKEPRMDNLDNGLCVICGDKLLGPILVDRRSITCGPECHEIFVEFFEGIVGKFKEITLLETGISYKIPTRLVIEDGIKGEDLEKFPLWDGNNCK